MDIGPRVEVSKISVSSKLSTSRTPVMERRLRESSVSRCGPTVGGHLDFIAALLEVEAQKFADGRFIVYDEDLHGIILSSVRVCRLLPTYIRGKDGPMQLFYVQISRYMAAASSLRTASATASTSTVTVRAPKAMAI